MTLQTLPKLYTYQDLMAEAQVSYPTVWRWFRFRKKFKLKGTVRILHDDAVKFIEENSKNEKASN